MAWAKQSEGREQESVHMLGSEAMVVTNPDTAPTWE